MAIKNYFYILYAIQMSSSTFLNTQKKRVLKSDKLFKCCDTINLAAGGKTQTFRPHKMFLLIIVACDVLFKIRVMPPWHH